ncbi:MAG: C40 family peptidase [Flavobacteriales bacterium]
MSYGICHLTAVPLRKEPSDKSEMTSQLLFGETFEIIQKEEKWSMVTLSSDGYTGWIDNKQYEEIESLPKTSAATVSAPLFVVQNGSGAFTFIPAGGQVYFNSPTEIVCGKSTFKCGEQDGKNATSPAELALGGMIFLGTPYLWGGKTLTGMDCSGFTQLVFKMNGKQIPRDAFQQAELGVPISFIDEAETGDLAFFDNSEGRITHVGIILNQKELGTKSVIHASGQVRLDKIDHQGIFNEETKSYSHQLRIIKRIDK